MLKFIYQLKHILILRRSVRRNFKTIPTIQEVLHNCKFMDDVATCYLDTNFDFYYVMRKIGFDNYFTKGELDKIYDKVYTNYLVKPFFDN